MDCDAHTNRKALVLYRDAPDTETGRLRPVRCVREKGWPLRRAAKRSSRSHSGPCRTPTRTERRIIKVCLAHRWDRPGELVHVDITKRGTSPTAADTARSRSSVTPSPAAPRPHGSVRLWGSRTRLGACCKTSARDDTRRSAVLSGCCSGRHAGVASVGGEVLTPRFVPHLGSPTRGHGKGASRVADPLRSHAARSR